MTEETNDMKPCRSGKKLPPSLERQLAQPYDGKGTEAFREQLPEAFLSDASEGLESGSGRDPAGCCFKTAEPPDASAAESKKKRNGKKIIVGSHWTYWAILIILLLTICAFLVIRMLLHH